MIRILGVAVVGLVLLAGPCQSERLSKKDYIARVHAIARSVPDDALDQLVNTRFIPCRASSGPGDSCRVSSGPDDAVAYGAAWIRKERRFRIETLSATDRLQRLAPPKGVASLQDRWVKAIRFCVARMDGLVPRVPSRDSEGTYNPSSREQRFEKEVADASESCHLYEIFDEFDRKGYSAIR